MLLQEKGRLDEALVYMQKSVGVSRKALGAKHPDMATHYLHIAFLLREMGQLEGALAHVQSGSATG